MKLSIALLAALLASGPLAVAADSAPQHQRLKFSFVTVQCGNMLTTYAVMNDGKDTVVRYRAEDEPFEGFAGMWDFVAWLNSAPSYSAEAACPDGGAAPATHALRAYATAPATEQFWPIAINDPRCPGGMVEEFGYRVMVLCWPISPARAE